MNIDLEKGVAAGIRCCCVQYIHNCPYIDVEILRNELCHLHLPKSDGRQLTAALAFTDRTVTMRTLLNIAPASSRSLEPILRQRILLTTWNCS